MTITRTNKTKEFVMDHNTTAVSRVSTVSRWEHTDMCCSQNIVDVAVKLTFDLLDRKYDLYEILLILESNWMVLATLKRPTQGVTDKCWSQKLDGRMNNL